MRVCTTCKKELDESLFSIRSDTGKKRNQCNSCRGECIKRTRKTPSSITKLTKRKEYNRRMMNKLKSFKGCYVCGLKYTECLDFHHVNMDDKDFTPSEMLSKSTQQLKNELKKCIVLCSNHHRMVHSGRFVLERNK